MSPDVLPGTAGAALAGSPPLRHRVLCDLSFASLGHTGISQDTRLMFSTFVRSAEVDPTGLILSHFRFAPSVGRLQGTRKIDTELSSSLLLNDISLERNLAFSQFRRPRQLASIVKYLSHLALMKPTLWEVPSDILGDPIWRLLFARSLPAAERQAVLGAKFVAANFTLGHVRDRTDAFSALGPVKLNTTGYDFVVFQDSQRIRVSPGSRKIIRYHDPIPIHHPDTIGRFNVGYHLPAIRSCATDSFFVCNSEQTRLELVRLEPRLEGRSSAIPYRIEQELRPAARDLPFWEIARARLSFAALGESPASRITDQIEAEVARLAGERKTPRYILALSTIEPRKNFIGVITAWERLLFTHGNDVKLVIVGKPGWRFERILAAMRPRVTSGQLLHLEDLTFAEIQALYRQAECLVFPSFAEGFGFPPIEAMVCGTPSVVSDLPVHRWVMEDAVLYADPYDTDAIAAQIERLVYDENRAALRATLQDRAPRILARYDRSAIEAQWNNLFDRLRSSGPA